MSFSKKQSVKKIMIKILKNKYLTYFVALFTLFFVNEIISNPNNQIVLFVKILFSNICLRILTFMAILVIGFQNITLGMLLLINFIFLISVPQQVEEFSNNLPDLIDQNKILKYQKNFNNKEKSNKEKDEDEDENKNENLDKKEKNKENYNDLDVNDYLPKKKVEKKIRSPIRIKESEEIEKASKELEKAERKDRQNKIKRKKNEEFDETDNEDDNTNENYSEKKDFDDEGKLKKEKRKEMSSNNYEDDEDEIDSHKKKFNDYKYEDTDDTDDNEETIKKSNTKKMYYKKQKDRKKKRQNLLKELKEMDLEEKQRIENEKEMDGTIEASLKYKNYDKKLNLRMLEEDTEDDESSSSSESSGSSSSSESSSESSSKEYEDVSLTEAREHVLNKLRNKIKKKYVKG